MKLSYEIKTAIIVLSGIVLFIIGFSYLKSNDVFVSDRVFYAVYDDVEGVSKGTPVTISGFNVGSVQDIRFYKNTSKLLLKFGSEKKGILKKFVGGNDPEALASKIDAVLIA